MTKNRNWLRLFFLLLMLANFGIDQLSKILIRKYILPSQRIDLVYHHFMIMNVENTGAFLSLGAAWPAAWRFILLSGIPILLLAAALGFLLFGKPQPLHFSAGLCFVIGGGLGNLLDRILYGSVTDFLFIQFGPVQTGIFNLGDFSIIIGAALIALPNFFKPSMKKQAGSQHTVE